MLYYVIIPCVSGLIKKKNTEKSVTDIMTQTINSDYLKDEETALITVEMNKLNVHSFYYMVREKKTVVYW